MHSEQGCPCNGWAGLYAICECEAIRQRAHTAALLENTDELRKAKTFLLGDTNEGCGGGVHALVDKLQADVEILRREREAIKDCLKITDVVSALAAVERIVYMGMDKKP